MTITNGFRRNFLERKIEGAVLAEVVGLCDDSRGMYECLDVELLVSNFQDINKKIKITLFKNSNNRNGAEYFIKFFKENNKEEILGSLFYANIAVDKKGYYRIDKLYFKINEKDLNYDPRIKIRVNNNEKYDIFAE